MGFKCEAKVTYMDYSILCDIVPFDLSVIDWCYVLPSPSSGACGICSTTRISRNSKMLATESQLTIQKLA